MNWRSRRFLGLTAIICIILATSVGTWIYLVNRSQNASSNQWIHLPSSKPGQPAPTAPPNGYLFRDASGGFVVHNLPEKPPTTITWMTYRNQQDGYAIDYPSNWIQIKNSSNGHDGQALYPPGTNLNENVPGGPKGIGFRWVETQIPVPTDQATANLKPITINGVTGQIYTQAALGATIGVIFPYKGGSFILTADADSDTLIYVFQHMLDSLKFL